MSKSPERANDAFDLIRTANEKLLKLIVVQGKKNCKVPSSVSDLTTVGKICLSLDTFAEPSQRRTMPILAPWQMSLRHLAVRAGSERMKQLMFSGRPRN